MFQIEITFKESTQPIIKTFIKIFAPIVIDNL